MVSYSPSIVHWYVATPADVSASPKQRQGGGAIVGLPPTPNSSPALLAIDQVEMYGRLSMCLLEPWTTRLYGYWFVHLPHRTLLAKAAAAASPAARWHQPITSPGPSQSSRRAAEDKGSAPLPRSSQGWRVNRMVSGARGAPTLPCRPITLGSETVSWGQRGVATAHRRLLARPGVPRVHDGPIGIEGPARSRGS